MTFNVRKYISNILFETHVYHPVGFVETKELADCQADDLLWLDNNQSACSRMGTPPMNRPNLEVYLSFGYSVILCPRPQEVLEVTAYECRGQSGLATSDNSVNIVFYVDRHVKVYDVTEFWKVQAFWRNICGNEDVFLAGVEFLDGGHPYFLVFASLYGGHVETFQDGVLVDKLDIWFSLCEDQNWRRRFHYRFH